MSSLYNILKYIFLNRYRQLTYLDSGRFYFFAIVYLIGILKLSTWENEYSASVIFVIFCLQNISFLQRNDFIFLKNRLGKFRALRIIIIDLFLLSIPLLFITSFKSFSFLLIEILLLITLPMLLTLKKRSSSIGIFSSKDPLWSTYAKKKPWGFILLIIIYYVQYQALSIDNIGLFYVASCSILLFVLNIFSEDEYLIYLKISDKKLQKYLIGLLLTNLKNIIYISAPGLLLTILFLNITAFLSVLFVIFCASILFWTRFFFNDNLIKNFFGLIVIILIASLYDINKLFLILPIILVNIILIKPVVHY